MFLLGTVVSGNVCVLSWVRYHCDILVWVSLRYEKRVGLHDGDAAKTERDVRGVMSEY